MSAGNLNKIEQGIADAHALGGGSYTKTTWVNGSSTPLNNTNLNKIEQGIADAHALAGAGQRIAGVTSGGLNSSYDPPTAEGLIDTNARAQRQHAVYNWFQPLNNANPPDYFTVVAAEGAIPMTTLQQHDDENILDRILAGDYDAALDMQATNMATHDGTIYLRFLHEMNSDWMIWGTGYVNLNTNTVTNTAQKYVNAWIRAYSIMKPIVPNAEWIWCPSIAGAWAGGDTPFASLYPGDAYVDWMALDGYNFYKTKDPDGTWITFTQLMQSSYDQITALSATKKLMIAETSCAEDASDVTRKANWITDMYTDAIPNTMPRISCVVFFDVDRMAEENVNLMYNTTQNSLDAYRTCVNHTDWSGVG